MHELTKLADEAERRERVLRANALRAIRRLDRPLARFALKRWKDSDECAKAASDLIIYGSGCYRVEHVPMFGD